METVKLNINLNQLMDAVKQLSTKGSNENE